MILKNKNHFARAVQLYCAPSQTRNTTLADVHLIFFLQFSIARPTNVTSRKQTAMMMKQKAIFAVLLASVQNQLTKGHLRNTIGAKKRLPQANLKRGNNATIAASIEHLVEEKFFHISEEGVNESNRKLQDPCTGEGEEINGIKIE